MGDEKSRKCNHPHVDVGLNNFKLMTKPVAKGAGKGKDEGEKPKAKDTANLAGDNVGGTPAGSESEANPSAKAKPKRRRGGKSRSGDEATEA